MHIIYNVVLTQNKIIIKFDKLLDISILLNILNYYFNEKNCIISKILLVVNRQDLKWYNDITSFKKKPLLYLLIKLKEELKDTSHVSSHIIDSELNNKFYIEIYTLNINNNLPILIQKNELLKLMFDDWVSHM